MLGTKKGDLPLTALRIVSLTVTLRSEVVTMERCWAFTSDETTEEATSNNASDYSGR